MIRFLPAMVSLTAAAALWSLPGCVSDEPQRKPMAAPPANVKATKLGVWATLPEDSDSNGYLDTVDLTVYVSSDTYAAPIAIPGSFEFHLVGKGGKDLAKWEIPEKTAVAALRRMPAGPAYVFRLNILDVGKDEFEAQAVDLSAEFIPNSGPPVRAPMTGLRFGKIRV